MQINLKTLSKIDSVVKPNFDLANRKIGIIHMGLGAFHRGHQAVFFDSALSKGSDNFAIAAVSQRSAKNADQLQSQQGLFTVLERSLKVNSPRIVGSIAEAYFYPRDESKLKEIIEQKNFQAITVTATEKAYKADSDLIIRLSRLLNFRFNAKLPGICVISCDNLTNNTKVLKQLIIDYSKKLSNSNFSKWIEQEVRFPNSMVDRIVPATTTSDQKKFESEFGYFDNSLICTEPFIQWVIEHDPISEKLNDIGIEFVADVDGYEMMKLRLFNALHTALSIYGQLNQIEFVAKVISEPHVKKFAEKMQLQASASFPAPQGVDLTLYSAMVRDRIANPMHRHRTGQICIDTSQKLPHRIFGTINDLIKKNLPYDTLAFTLALWIHYLATSKNNEDPQMDPLVSHAKILDSKVSVNLVFSDLRSVPKLNLECYSKIVKFLDSIRSKSNELSLIETI